MNDLKLFVIIATIVIPLTYGTAKLCGYKSFGTIYKESLQSKEGK